MRFCGIVLGWLLGFLTGLVFAFMFLVFLDTLPIWEPPLAPIIGWIGWVKLFAVAIMILSIYTMDWNSFASNDATVQSTPVENRSVQTVETPLDVSLRNVMNETLLSGIERHLDGLDQRLDQRLERLEGLEQRLVQRLDQPLEQRVDQLLEQRLDDTRTYDAFQWLTGFAPDPSDENDHDHPPPTLNNVLNNSHQHLNQDDDDNSPPSTNGHISE
ncbi:uncharacterized protein N7484_000531 [Penicillium longicatenatum]|uniref:uncharacterized protein n=1 Tax=Penicillium longicatenatum TaxID=1561947 RepID=UPI00254767D7|nr:uncharacterized protein N7484_000531 [Penicillium longicatenatum]KAJ5661159.1 hypothetical protein N7484_000531 [Penicillium longicatenatum]